MTPEVSTQSRAKVVRVEYRAWGPMIAAHDFQTEIVVAADIEDAIYLIRDRWIGQPVEFSEQQMREQHGFAAELLTDEGVARFRVDQVEFVSAEVVGELLDVTEPTRSQLGQSHGAQHPEPVRVFDCVVEIVFAQSEDPGWAGKKAQATDLVLARHVSDVLEHWRDVAVRSHQPVSTGTDKETQAKLESATLLNATSLGTVYGITATALPRVLELAETCE